MSLTPKTKWLLLGATGLLVAVGGTVGATAAVLDDDDQEERYPATVVGPDVYDLPVYDLPDAVEEQVLADAARITPEQATAAALDAAPGGTVTEVDLDDEYGGVVYQVEVRTPTGEIDVVIDAGTAKVLAIDRDD